MWGNRILYITIMICLWIMYIFGNNSGTMTVAVGITLFPFLLFTNVLFLRKSVIISFGRNKFEKNHISFLYRITLRHNIMKHFIFGIVSIETEMINLYTDEKKYLTFDFFMTGKKVLSQIKVYEMEYCGVYRYKISKVTISDILHLWKLEINLEQQNDIAEEYQCLYPEYFYINLNVGEDINAMIEGDRYSNVFPGDDPGEIFGLHEYIPGEPLKKIHRKLSEKTGKTLVREFGRPVVNQVLIIFENTLREENINVNAKEADAIAQSCFSLCDALVEKEIIFTLVYFDHEIKEPASRVIYFKDDYIKACDEIFRQGYQVEEMSAVMSFSDDMERCSYAHVVVFSVNDYHDSNVLYNGNHLTLITVNRGDSQLINEKFHGDVVSRKYISVNNPEEELNELTV